MTCYSPEGVGRLQWNRAGDTFRLFRGEPSCSTRCLSVGPRGFKVDLRTLDTIPTVHPAMLREVSTFQGAPNPLDINTDKQTFNRLHDIIQKDVKENKEMLTDMHDKDDKEDTWQIDNWKIGLGGTLTLATTAACAALLFCLLRRGATCCRPDHPPPPGQRRRRAPPPGRVPVQQPHLRAGEDKRRERRGDGDGGLSKADAPHIIAPPLPALLPRSSTTPRATPSCPRPP